MKRLHLLILIFSVLIVSCAPVLRPETMATAGRDISFSELKADPDFYKGRLFVLGGIIVQTKVVAEGSLIEALYVSVNSRGYLMRVDSQQGRFLALYPKEAGLLDPMIYRRGKEITLAGEFLGTREGKIDEVEYLYPLFEIKELYLWEERMEYYPPYYPYPYFYYYDPFFYDPFYYDPFFRHRFFRPRWW